MRVKHLIIYGVIMGLLFVVMEALNYNTMIRQVSLELYGVLVGGIFLLFGLWIGLTIVKVRQYRTAKKKPAKTNLSDREYDVLSLMADGKSNQEIADQLFVSLNTIKTHTSNIFAKLDVKRRTQAIQRAREMKII